jgi:DNA-binding helix-turn-helix protein|nr:MAG TPA: helix-turn-helix domain protein [Caudoviricetes sp.]
MNQKARLNLISARKNKQYTQTELASKLNITERQYQRLEAGTSKGSVDVWEKLKLILRAESIDWLLKQSGKNTLNK